MTDSDFLTTGSRVTKHGYSDVGTVTKRERQGDSVAMYVEWDHTGSSWEYESDLHAPGRQHVIDVRNWSRLAEVDRYAEGRNIDRGQAINELVNAALSHEVWQ